MVIFTHNLKNKTVENKILEMISKTIGLGSRKDFRFATRTASDEVKIIMEDVSQLDNAMKRLEKIGLLVRLQEGEISCKIKLNNS